MKQKIKGRVYDTENAENIGYKFTGEFGQSDGYEEQLYITKTGQLFIYGIGGADSPYPEPAIKLAAKEEAEQSEWVKKQKDSGDGNDG